LRLQGNDRRSHGKGTPLLDVEGADDRVTLDTVGVYAFARCSNEALRASVSRTDARATVSSDDEATRSTGDGELLGGRSGRRGAAYADTS
jgi:hypothetical protein